MVPVFLSLNLLASGLACPYGRPKVAPEAVWVWVPVGLALWPAILPTPGFDVVPRLNELAVGIERGLCLDTCLFALGGT